MPDAHVPHEPPQPSSPHDLPAQLGLQAHCPAAVHVPWSHSPHDPPQPSGPQARPAHAGTQPASRDASAPASVTPPDDVPELPLEPLEPLEPVPEAPLVPLEPEDVAPPPSPPAVGAGDGTAASASPETGSLDVELQAASAIDAHVRRARQIFTTHPRTAARPRAFLAAPQREAARRRRRRRESTNAVAATSA